METFTQFREFVEHPQYPAERERTLAALDLASIDEPIVDIVAGLNALSHCFTLQCCYGHFLCAPHQDPRTLDAIPHDYSGSVRYRIAYMALCLENSPRGRVLRETLARLPLVAPGYVQFGSADWFWERSSIVNSYAVQVEPDAYQLKDEAILQSAEAFQTERARNRFFTELRSVVALELTENVAG